MHENKPFSIPAMRDFVPEKLRPWIIILIVIVFQFSGGIYLAAVSEMVGSLAPSRRYYDGGLRVNGRNGINFYHHVPT